MLCMQQYRFLAYGERGYIVEEEIKKLKLGFRHRQYEPFDADERVVRSSELRLAQQQFTFKFEEGSGLDKIVIPQCYGEMTLHEILVTRKHGFVGHRDDTIDIPVRNKFVAQIDLAFGQVTLYKESKDGK